MITELENPKIYDDFIHSRDVVLVHFWAKWNATDYSMKQRLNELETQYKNLVAFGCVDVDIEKMWDVCIAVGMKNVPALAFYQHGKFTETVIGLMLKEVIEAKLNNLLNDVISPQ